MMRTKLTLVAASLATLMMTTAHAAPAPVEADLSISAKVVPSACSFDVANNGTFDYGDIQASTLSPSAATRLPDKQLNYVISCNAPKYVSFSVVDNRRGTATDHITWDIYSFGLGQHNGVNIGSNTYRQLTTPTVDGTTGSTLVTPDGGTSWWGIHVNEDEIFDIAGYAWSFSSIPVSPNAQASPTPITTVNGVFEANVNIAPGSTLDLTREINIDGFATMQLTYI